jgi:hypothetical protein
VDSMTVKAWLEGLGLHTSIRAGAAGEEVCFGLAGSTEQPGIIRWRTPTVMDVFHVRPVAAHSMTAQWRDPSNGTTPAAVLRTAVRNVALAFPLVEGNVADDAGGGVIVYFSAPVFEEPPSRQAFALTVSAVLKAAATLEAGANARAEQLAALAQLTG